MTEDLNKIPYFRLEGVYLKNGQAIPDRRVVIARFPWGELPVTIISDRYTLLQHKDLIKMTRSILRRMKITDYHEHIQFGVRRKSPYYGVMFYTVEFSGRFTMETSGREFIPGITMINSVDASVRLAVLPRVTVVSCLNVLANPTEGTIIRRHVGDLVGFVKENLPKAIEQCLMEGIQNTASLWDDSFLIDLDTVTQLMEGEFPKGYIERVRAENPETLADLMQILTQLNTYDPDRNIESKYEGMRQIIRLAHSIMED